MAVEAESEESEAAPASKGGGRKRIIIIGAAALIAVLAIGSVLYFVVGIGKPAPSPSMAAAAQQSFIFNLPEMTVNLDTSGEGQSFMKLTVALEVTNEAMMNEIQPRLAKVIDAFQVYLRELRPSDLQGSAGIYRLKEELLRRVNVAIAPAQIEGILFKEILVQ